MLLDEACGLLLLVPADLADEDDQLRLGIVVEPSQDVDERRADDGIPADSDDRRVAEGKLCQLVSDLVRQRSRPGDEADRSFAEDLGMIPTFAFPGESAPGQFGPIIATPLPRTYA